MVDKKKGKVKSTYVKENPHRKELVQAGFEAVDFIVEEKIDALITKELGGTSFHTLRDNLVDIYKAEGKTAKDAIKNFIENKLEYLKEPTKKGQIPTVERPTEIVRERGSRRRRGTWWRRSQ